jgi:hypothetical protein
VGPEAVVEHPPLRGTDEQSAAKGNTMNARPFPRRRDLRQQQAVLNALGRAKPDALDLVSLCSATALSREALQAAVADLERQHHVESVYSGGGRIQYRAR